MSVAEGIRLTTQILTWLGETIVAFVSGDDSPPVRRVVEVLPAQFRADLEHWRQERLMREELEVIAASKAEDDGQA